MRAHLTFVGGSRDGEELLLVGGGNLVIGASPECDVICADGDVSPHHFQIKRRGQFFVASDLNSTGGTLVNGARISSKTLEENDEITFGTLCLRYNASQSMRLEAISSPDALNHLCGNGNGNGNGNGHASGNGKGETSASGRVLIARNYDNEIDIGNTLARGGNDEETIQRLRVALDTIYRVSNLVLGEHNLDVLFNTVMDVVMDVIKPERAYLLMWHQGENAIEPVVVRRRCGNQGRRMLADDEIGPSTAVVNSSIKESLALITEDARVDPRFANSPSVQSLGIRGAMCVPVRSSTLRIGAIYVDEFSAERRFAEHELELLAAIGRQAGFAIERARIFEDMESLFYSCVRAMVTAIEAKDVYTHGHSERVAAFAVTIAEEMNVDADTMDAVRLGALLHDIGKIGVPEKILTKPARLTPDEIKIIRQHPARGGEILSHIRNIPDVIAAVRWHHEMFNGLGYPDGLEGKDMPTTARIVAVADAFDAMTSNRAYRRNFDVEEAVSEFQRCSGDQFAPEVCEVMQVLLRSGRIIPCNDLFARGIDVTTRVY